jgi:hypothetical protein
LIDSEFRIQESEFRISPMDECARRVEEKLVLGGLEIFRKAKEIARMVSSIRKTLGCQLILSGFLHTNRSAI